MGTHTSTVEASHTNHHWFTQLQAEPNRERAWVRILRLEAGRLGDPLSGRLTVEELNATEPFDALSYCCGPPVLNYSIIVNGASGFRITQNLWTALQRVRKTDSDRRIWVDAVCIDQEDEREKSSQVRHMHAVYSHAEEVCIYVGECRTRQYRESMRGHYLPEADETCQTSSYDSRIRLDATGYWAGDCTSRDYFRSVFPGYRIYDSPTAEFIERLEDELLYDPVYNASSRQT